MALSELSNLRIGLKSLTIFRSLLSDPVVNALCYCLDKAESNNEFSLESAINAYAEFVSQLYTSNAASLGEYIKDICENDENIYVRLIGSGRTSSEQQKRCVEHELHILQATADLNSDKLRGYIGWDGYLPEFDSGNVDIVEGYKHRTANIGKYGYGTYARNRMFFINAQNHIVPVKNPDSTTLASLVDYELERKVIIDNTKALLDGKPAANVLLTGDAGTGKSSTIKAVVNELYDEGLRIIEVRKDQLCVIPQILDELALNPLKFILFIDDLSFQKDDDNFNALKAVLEGSVSAKSRNVVIYATSNRRHIIKEKFSDREGDDIHRNDTMQEIISLSERFGIHVSFQKPDKKTYLHIVRHLADENGVKIDDSELELLAERFALERGGRSARLAKQFIEGLVSSGKYE
ncbi:MAG: ATP-binding protein [Clostridiales bacterium]|nr:ATP-binding protein [Clostridiales bacterium]